mgnify:CR=1 FL=1
MSQDKKPDQGAPSVAELQEREEQLAAAEFELAFADAELRAREAGLQGQRLVLSQRAQWLDQRVEHLERSATKRALDTSVMLQGLGKGAALEDADVDGYVKRSATLHLGRAAMVAMRAELATRRREHLDARADELETYEQAFDRADVRLTARERLVLAAVREIEKALLGEGEPGSTANESNDEASKTVSEPAAKTSSAGDRVLNDQWRQFELLRHAETITMDSREVEVRAAADHVPRVFQRPRDGNGTLPPPALATPDRESSALSGVPSFRPASQRSTGKQPSARLGGNHRATLTGDGKVAQARIPTISEPMPPDLPDDLPGAAGTSNLGPVAETANAELHLDGMPIRREQIELDRNGRILLVSAVQGLTVDDRVQLVYRAYDGDVRRFDALVQRLMPAGDKRGSAAVLSVQDWTDAEIEALSAALDTLPD